MTKKVFAARSKISETLLIPLYARAREQQKLPPLLVDPTAEQLVACIDYNFQQFELSPLSMTGVVIRAAYFDAIVRQFIQKYQHDEPVVVHLGCGLDTRYQRLGAIAKKAHFYQVDLEEVMAIRKELLPPPFNETLLAHSMFETQWMDYVATKHPHAMVIFIIEGVLMYFERTHNRQLFEKLATKFVGAEIHFDVVSSWLSCHTYLHDAVRLTDAKFKFGLDNDRLIEHWHPRLCYQGSVNLMGLEGWQRTGWPYLMGQNLWSPFNAMARVVAYLIK